MSSDLSFLDELKHLLIQPSEFQTVRNLPPVGARDLKLVTKEDQSFTMKICYDFDKTRFEREIKILASLDYPSVIGFHGFSLPTQEQKHAIILTTSTPHGNLASLINAEIKDPHSLPKGWNFTQKYIVAYGIARGMAYCHNKNIVHRGIKPINIELDENLEPKITNFDFAKLVGSEKLEISINFGQDKFIAPEIFNGELIDSKVDVYSYAILLFNLFTGLLPFPKLLGISYIDVINQGEQDTEPINDLPPIIRDLIIHCSSLSPEQRPTFQTIYELLETPKNLPIELDITVFQEYQNRLENYVSSSASIPHYSEDLAFQFFTKLAQDDTYVYLDEGAVHTKKNDLVKVKQIGRGGYGNVFKIIDDNKQYAMKTIYFGPGYTSTHLLRELSILSKLDHISILKLRGFQFGKDDDSESLIVTDLITKGDLSQMIQKEFHTPSQAPPEWDITQKLINLYGIAYALNYCHERNILHRDLKPENILLDENLEPHLCDFGLSKLVEDAESAVQHSISMATLYYTAPELINCEPVTSQIDVFSYGSLVYCMFVGHPPFQSQTPSYSYRHEMEHYGQREEGFVVEENISDKLKAIIEVCLDPNPSQRPPFSSILEQLCRTEMLQEDFDLDAERYEAYIQKLNNYTTHPQTSGLDSIIYRIKQKESKPVDNDSLLAAALKFESENQYQEAATLYQKVIDGNDHRGHFYFARLALHGLGVRKSTKTAIQHFQNAINGSDEISLQAQLELGQVYEKMRQYKKAADLYHTILTEVPLARTHYARLQLYGFGTKPSTKQAIKRLNKASKREYSDGGYGRAVLGRYYLESQKVNDAFALFQKSAEMNCAEGLNELGLCYLNGTGTQIDYDKAMECFVQASIQDHPNSYINLAKMYQEGLGVDKDSEFAISLLKKAARLISIDANIQLGHIYEESNDKKEATKYFKRASHDYDQQALIELGLFYKRSQSLQKKNQELEQSSYKYLKKAYSTFRVLANKYRNVIGLREFALCLLDPAYQTIIKEKDYQDYEDPSIPEHELPSDEKEKQIRMKGEKYLKIAADMGDDLAQFKFASILFSANKDKSQTLNQMAKKYLTEAAEKGNEQARSKLNSLQSA